MPLAYFGWPWAFLRLKSCTQSGVTNRLVSTADNSRAAVKNMDAVAFAFNIVGFRVGFSLLANPRLQPTVQLEEHLRVFTHRIPVFDFQNRSSTSDRFRNGSVQRQVERLSQFRFPKLFFSLYNGARSSMVERLIVSQDHAGSNPVVHPRRR